MPNINYPDYHKEIREAELETKGSLTRAIEILQNRIPEFNKIKSSSLKRTIGALFRGETVWYRKLYPTSPNILSNNYTEEAVLDLSTDKAKPVINKKKHGFETRDGYIINWSNNTIITDLGEFGNYIASFERHGMIQRAYVYDGESDTATQVAMKFDFPHAKAVYIYAKIHNFTKASILQTDFELENDITDVDQSVEEYVSTRKREIYKKTQKRKWKDTQNAADRWWDFENTALESIRSILTEEFTPPVFPKSLSSIITQKAEVPYLAIIGITDVHYLKLCYRHDGTISYNREIATKRLREHTISLATELSRYGTPDKICISLGNDNMHVDGLDHATTKGTLQHQATDGQWRLHFKEYVKLQLEMINYYKNIAPVVVFPVKGNHDYATSIAIQAFASLYYENDPNVTVLTNHDSRVYYQWHNICLTWTHGDELGSIPKLESEAHKLIMGEAKEQGIDVMQVTHYLLLHGHEHVFSARDLNGHVQRIGFSSMSDIDDWWHKEKGFVGREPESLVAIAEKGRGRRRLLWA